LGGIHRIWLTGVGREQAELDGVSGGVVEHFPLAGDGARCGTAAIQPQHERIERGPGDLRVDELGDGQ
jgi:hypothetical protein